MASQQSSNQSSQQQSSTFFSDPAMVQRLLDAMGSQTNQFNEYLSNPAASPLYTNQLRGLMASLAPQEAQARQAYTDAGVAAGNRSSGRFAQGQANLEGNIIRNQQATAGQLLGQNFSQMTQALLQAMGLTPQMLNALKLSQSSGSSQGSSQGSSDAGGGGGGGGGGGYGYGTGLQGPSFGNYGAGNAITQPGVGAAYGGTSGWLGPNYDPSQIARASDFQPQNATWFDPSGNFVSGAGPGETPFSPSGGGVDEWGYTQQDWANDPFYQ